MHPVARVSTQLYSLYDGVCILLRVNQIKSLEKPSFATKYCECFFISCTLARSQHVSALIKGHLQVILYNKKYLKESYNIISNALYYIISPEDGL
jgi:hypothetical protein